MDLSGVFRLDHLTAVVVGCATVALTRTWRSTVPLFASPTTMFSGFRTTRTLRCTSESLLAFMNKPLSVAAVLVQEAPRGFKRRG